VQQHDSDACLPNAFFGKDLCLRVIRTASGRGEARNQRVNKRARQAGSLGDLALAQQPTFGRHRPKVIGGLVRGPPPPHRLMKRANMAVVVGGDRFATYGANWIAALLGVQSVETRPTKIRALIAPRTGLGSIYGRRSSRAR
jgi:hypothetical protein